jgi:hypothetical protein
VRALLKAGADVNLRDESGNSAFLFAATRGYADLGKVCVCVCVWVGGWVGLSSSFSASNACVCLYRDTHARARPLTHSLAFDKVLLKAGADVDAADSTGRTAIHWAAKAKSPALLEALLPQAFRCGVWRSPLVCACGSVCRVRCGCTCGLRCADMRAALLLCKLCSAN